MRILDAGCGRGDFVFELAQKGEVYGIDFSEKFVAEAKKEARKRGLNCIFKKAILEKIPYPAEFFDEVHCHHTLEHVKDFEKSIKELARVLKRKGRLCVTIPHAKIERIMKKVFPDYYKQYLHLRIIESKQLKRQFEKRGFISKKEDCSGFLRAVARLLRAKLGMPFEEQSGLVEEKNFLVSALGYLDFIANVNLKKISKDLKRRKMTALLPVTLLAKPFLKLFDVVLSRFLAYEYRIMCQKV